MTKGQTRMAFPETPNNENHSRSLPHPLAKGERKFLKTLFLHSLLLASLLSGTAARGDVLDQAVTLKAEADLVQAISLTLRHAVATSEQYQGKNVRLQRFARREISMRRKPIDQLGRLARHQASPIKSLAIVPRNDRSYVQAMMRNHARLLELIEHGGGLRLSPETKRLMATLSRGAASELATLSLLQAS
jgi:hypothetical protein